MDTKKILDVITQHNGFNELHHLLIDFIHLTDGEITDEKLIKNQLLQSYNLNAKYNNIKLIVDNLTLTQLYKYLEVAQSMRDDLISKMSTEDQKLMKIKIQSSIDELAALIELKKLTNTFPDLFEIIKLINVQ